MQILVFRALMLGDWLCATPALRALRRAFPDARLALCGLPWTRALAERLSGVDEFIEFPGHPDLPERRATPAAVERFAQAQRERGFDLALQMHGSGATVNPLVASFGARCSVGFAPSSSEPGLDIAVPWPDAGPEVARCLALPAALGAPSAGRQIDFPLRPGDRALADLLLEQAGVTGPYAIVHPGSQWPSRRWPPQRFAAVAEALAAAGLQVVITGSADEAPLAHALREAARCATVDLCGRTPSLWALGALVESAEIVVANDTGISHVAAALRTPSVIVASGSDVARWAPLDRTLHRVLWHDTPCRPCAHPACPTEHECARGVGVHAVAAAALALLESSSSCHTRHHACAS